MIGPAVKNQRNSDFTAKTMSIPTWIQGSNTSGGIGLEHLRQISQNALLGKNKSTESLLKDTILRAGTEDISSAYNATQELNVLITCAPIACIESILSTSLLPLLSSRIMNHTNNVANNNKVSTSSVALEVLTLLFHRWDEFSNTCRIDLNTMMTSNLLSKLCSFNSPLDPECKHLPLCLVISLPIFLFCFCDSLYIYRLVVSAFLKFKKKRVFTLSFLLLPIVYIYI